jgi:hypothetical protein
MEAVDAKNLEVGDVVRLKDLPVINQLYSKGAYSDRGLKVGVEYIITSIKRIEPTQFGFPKNEEKKKPTTTKIQVEGSPYYCTSKDFELVRKAERIVKIQFEYKSERDKNIAASFLRGL